MADSPPPRRLVAISIAAIDPPRRGNQIRTANLLAHLGTHWEVESFSMMMQRTDLPLPRTLHRVTERWTDHRSRDPLMVAWTSVMARLGYPSVYASELLRIWPRGAVRRALALADVALVSPPYPFKWVRNNAPTDLPLVLDVHSIEADMYRPRSAWWTKVISREVDREERGAVRDADLSFVTCDADRAKVEAIGARRVAVVRNGVDVRRFVPRGDAPVDAVRRALGLPTAGTLGVFVGSGHPPNVEAVEQLERDADRYRTAGITIVVVGRCGTGRRPVGNVIHAGEVRDVLPYLHAADLALCPLRTGSGTSLKTIEYLAAGVPLVTTAFGVRGLDVVPGVEAEVCDLEDIPARSGALAADPSRRASLARGARLAAERFSWQEIGAEATRALDEVVARRAPAR